MKKNPFKVINKSTQATLCEAITILGEDKIITPKAHAKAWGNNKSKDVPILYSVNSLKEVAQENKYGKADWRLAYLNGYSLVKQRKLRGCGYGDLTKFNNWDWWLDQEKKKWQEKVGQYYTYWAEKKSQPGYYLINVAGDSDFKDWKISANKKCPEEIFSELILTIGLVKGEKVCFDWTHCGRFTSFARKYYSRYYITVRLSNNGIEVADTWMDPSCLPSRVALFRNFDF